MARERAGCRVVPSVKEGAAEPLKLLVGSLHCHSTGSDGSGSPEEILEKAAAVGLDFVAITDHVPQVAGDVPAPRPRWRAPSGGRSRVCGGGRPVRAPLVHRGVLLLPGLEYSPPKNHYLVLGLGPAEAPVPEEIPGWPDPASYVEAVNGRPGVLGFVAHPDDEGNPFLGVRSYRWEDWTVRGFTGLEVWNLSTDWSRLLRSRRDVIRAFLAGLYRAVPPPNPRTVARWDRLAASGHVVGIAGTDAHAYPARWRGLRFTVFPYERAFSTLQTAVWVESGAVEGPPEARAAAVLKALERGRAFMLNRAWGRPHGFTFQAREVDGDGCRYVSGDTVPAGRRVRFEVALPASAWIRLVRNGTVVANTFGRELTFEPLAPPAAGGREAWRVEAWVDAVHWTRAGSGFFLWIMSNFIYCSP